MQSFLFIITLNSYILHLSFIFPIFIIIFWLSHILLLWIQGGWILLSQGITTDGKCMVSGCTCLSFSPIVGLHQSSSDAFSCRGADETLQLLRSSSGLFDPYQLLRFSLLSIWNLFAWQLCPEGTRPIHWILWYRVFFLQNLFCFLWKRPAFWMQNNE